METHEISLMEKFDLENAPRRKRKRRVKVKSKKAPEASLDLHGQTVDEALKNLQSFLKTSRLKGYYLIKVIHGKGLHSPGEAKLKTFVEEYLNKEGKKYIVSFETAPLNDGGSGAVYIFL